MSHYQIFGWYLKHVEPLIATDNFLGDSFCLVNISQIRIFSLHIFLQPPWLTVGSLNIKFFPTSESLHTLFSAPQIFLPLLFIYTTSYFSFFDLFYKLRDLQIHISLFFLHHCIYSIKSILPFTKSCNFIFINSLQSLPLLDCTYHEGRDCVCHSPQFPCQALY